MSDSHESAADTKNILVEYWHSHIDIVSNISVFDKKKLLIYGDHTVKC